MEYFDLYHLKIIWQFLIVALCILTFFKYKDTAIRLSLFVLVIGYLLSNSGFFDAYTYKEVPLWIIRIGVSGLLIRLATGVQILLPRIGKKGGPDA